ncbi:hypothetical protein TNCV_184161 [Trichonephila clavipes]|nr:hypothetical protein TNCV_184161 [Trichonephila clavipes]
MAAVNFLHKENPPTLARVEPATLGAEDQTREAERDFCDLPIRRDEERVVDPPLVLTRVCLQETGELERGALPWMEKKEKALSWIEK